MTQIQRYRIEASEKNRQRQRGSKYRVPIADSSSGQSSFRARTVAPDAVRLDSQRLLTAWKFAQYHLPSIRCVKEAVDPNSDTIIVSSPHTFDHFGTGAKFRRICERAALGVVFEVAGRRSAGYFAHQGRLSYDIKLRVGYVRSLSAEETLNLSRSQVRCGLAFFCLHRVLCHDTRILAGFPIYATRSATSDVHFRRLRSRLLRSQETSVPTKDVRQ